MNNKFTLKQLIKQNKFDYVNSDITSENFPDNKERGKDYKLFNFKRYISSKDAIKEMDKENYRPCNLYELLEWKDWNKKDWVVALVVALGSVWQGFFGTRHVAYLDGFDSRRRLYLRIWDGGWDEGYRFLAVRKSGTKALEPSDSVLERLCVLEKFKSRVEDVLKL